MTTAANRERAELCDLLDEVGPDAPTLCGDWTTRDLAAHIVMRERRPDGAGGVLLKPLARHADNVQAKIAAAPWPELVDTIRSGPPGWSPMRFDVVDRLANTVEFFVHHEDVRRATDPWEPRQLPAELTADLSVALKRMARLLARSAPGGLVLEPTDTDEAGARAAAGTITAHKGEPAVTVTGPVGELVLFVYGRQDQSVVELDGDPDLVAATRVARFGI